MNTLLALVLLPSAVSAQTWTGHAFCMCPSGRRGNVQLPETCESFCGVDEGGGGGSSGPDWNAVRAQQQRAEQEAREREAAAAAARRVRAAMEQRKFEADKREAVAALKGVSTGGTRLKGVENGDTHGLRGLENGGVKLKGLVPEREETPSEEDAPQAKKCRIVDTCAEALESQTQALDAARREQSDLYMAMGTADFQHGLDLAHAGFAEKLKSMIQPVAKIKMWKDEDQAGLAMYQRDYKTTVDDILKLANQKRAAALGGKLDPAKTSLGRSEGGKLVAKDLFAQWSDKKEKLERSRAFGQYLRALSDCGKVAPAEYPACVERAGSLHGAILDFLPVAEATQARVKAMGDAYKRYTTRALERAMDVTKAAAKCFSGCR